MRITPYTSSLSLYLSFFLSFIFLFLARRISKNVPRAFAFINKYKKKKHYILYAWPLCYTMALLHTPANAQFTLCECLLERAPPIHTSQHSTLRTAHLKYGYGSRKPQAIYNNSH